MSIQITTDSTCDLNPTELERFGIRKIPLYIHMGEETFRDGVDIHPKDIFNHVAAGGALCGTAAVNIADYVSFFEVLAADHEAVIHICISSEFSSCFCNARMAAAEFPNVFVVDSRNLSTGHGLMVLRAAEEAAAGKPAAEILRELEEMKGKLRASFILDSLEYIRKGGRCSSVAALGANLLKLKPRIEVLDGRMQLIKKYRGSMEKCAESYVTDCLQDGERLCPDRCFVTHSGIAPSLLEAVVRQVEQSGIFREILVTEAGCTISSHCGPGAMGVLFAEK